MTDQDQQDINTELAVLKTKSIEQEKKLESLELTVGRIEKAVNSIASQVTQVGKTDLKSLSSYALAAVVLIGALWGLGINPVKIQLENQDRELYDIQKQLHEITLLRNDTALKLEEIEVQFRAGDTIRNLEIQQQDRLNAIIWQQIFNTTLPPKSYWPEIGKYPIPQSSKSN